MRSSVSSHHLSYRTKVRTQPGHPGYLTLSCKSILHLLHALLDESSHHDESSTATGQKRLHSLSHGAYRKRRNFDSGQSGVYRSPNESIPAFHHEFNLEYSKECPEVRRYTRVISDNEAEEDGLTLVEESLMLFLRNSCVSQNEPITLDCGDVLIKSHGEHGGIVDAKPSHLEEQWADLCNIFLIPPLYAEGMETGDGHLFSWADTLTQSMVHQSAVQVTACLRMVVSPLISWDETLRTLPFRLVVDVMLSFHTPTIFRPFANPRNGWNRTEIEKARRGLLDLAFPPPLPETSSPLYHRRIDVPFLYAIVQPASAILDESGDGSLQPQALLPTLLPFQRRTIGWMLSREGKTLDSSGELVAMVTDPTELPVLWRRITLQRGEEHLTWYYHRLTGTLSPERPGPWTVMGGILAEEPGLGKTLECIALILLNPGIGRSLSYTRWDNEATMTIREIRTTLIVTPSSLSQQWIDELARHAPSLKVLVYPGWKSLSIGEKLKKNTKKNTSKQDTKGKAKDVDMNVIDVDDASVSLLDSWPAYVNDFDVCITTYDVLRRDLNVARAAPLRPARQTAEYSREKRPISPLVTCEWYRVIMDEVQMVGGGKASEMVSLIPRLSSFAVSGTPAKTRISDLSYVLKFLRVDPSIYAPRNWNRLIQPSYAAEFTEVFRKYTVRTMKSSVQAELTIPAQTRYVFPIHLGKVERHVYDESFEKALTELGLDTHGVSTSQNGEINTTLLRTWLRKLRQLCTHPQVGQLQKPGDRLYKPGVLKTMQQVLEGMKDQNWRNVIDDRRSKVNEMATATQIMQHDDSIDQRPQKCLEILLRAEKEADEITADVLSVIAKHDAKGVQLKAEAASLYAERGTRPHIVDDDSSIDEDDESDDSGLPKTQAGEEHLHKSRALQQRLRDCYLTLHRVKFLQGDVFHWIGKSKDAEEATSYKAAEEIRSKILQFTEESAVRAMGQLRTDIGKNGLVEKDLLVKMPYCPRGGILSAYLLEEADKLIDQVLNAQSRLLWKWRTRIYNLLTQNLTANNDRGEVDGQEYSRTLDTQAEAEIYLRAYAMLLADRREVLSAERTILAVHDARQRKHRKTAAATKANFLSLEPADEPDLGLARVTDDIEPQPEHDALQKELMDARQTLLVNFGRRAVKSIRVDLMSVIGKIVKDDDPEKILAKGGMSSLRQLMSAQVTINEQIEADLALFRKAFNERILYFRQLQEISDSVGEAQWNDVDLALQRSKAIQTELERKIITGRARQRYLNHLYEEKDAGQDETDGGCILCDGQLICGYITRCAHVFCEDCMKAWLSCHGKACPVCRFPITVDALQRFSIRPKDKDKTAQPSGKLQSDAIPKSRRKIEYNTVGTSLLSEIDTMEVHGSFGTKIDTLVRHLLYLQFADPGAKSIVFSAWEDSLHIIEHALTRNGIPSIRIDSGNRKQDAATRFRNDPSILVLLLHGERQNAGLNVTCASRVFLLESVVHHSFEVQAIARIDRLGQLRPTEVYCYYAEDTVERNILDLGVRQGLSLYTANRARGTVDVTALASEGENSIVDAPAKKQQKGDFIFRLDDMMSILFPHLCEDVEFLVPPEEADVDVVVGDFSGVSAGGSVSASVSAGASSYAASPSRSTAAGRRPVHENAVAGPSRLN